MTQEIKKPSIDKQCFLSFWGGRKKEWAFTPAEGTAEWILVAWTTDLFDINAIKYGIYSLSVNLFLLVAFLHLWAFN